MGLASLTQHNVFQADPVLSRVLAVCSFLMLRSVPTYDCTTVCLRFFLLMDTSCLALTFKTPTNTLEQGLLWTDVFISLG